MSLTNPLTPAQSNIPRGSLVSVSTTISQSVGFSWCQILRKLRKQEQSFEAGMWLCVTALAVHYSYFYFDAFDQMDDVMEGDPIPISILGMAMWYLGACIGSIVCGFNIYTWPARMTHYVTALILFATSILTCLRDYAWMDVAVFTYIARFLAGGVYGFNYIVVITHISDNAWKMTRGYISVIMSFSTILSFMIAFLFSEHTWRTVTSYHLFVNISLFGFTALALLLTRSTYEPVTIYLKSNNLNEAERVFGELCNDVIEPIRIRSEVCEKARMMSEDYNDEINRYTSWLHIFKNGNGKPIVGMIMLRLLNVLTLNIFLLALSGAEMYDGEIFLMQIGVMIVRLCILPIPRYSLDKLGRKALLTISGIGSGICFLPFMANVLNFINIRGDLMAVITIFIHIFAAFGIEPLQHVYATEAFPLSKRNASLAFVTCFEYICNCIITIWWLKKRTTLLKVVLIATPFYLIIGSIILAIKLPETKGKSIRKCRAEFNKYYKSRPRLPGVHTIGSAYI